MGITQKTEAVGMYSAEGEFVEFGHSVLLEGPVEVEFYSLTVRLKFEIVGVIIVIGVEIKRAE